MQELELKMEGGGVIAGFYGIIHRMVASTISSLEQLKIVGGINRGGLDQFLEQLTSAGIDIIKQPNLENSTLKTVFAKHTEQV